MQTARRGMERGQRVFFAIALMVTLIGTFALCAKAYEYMRVSPAEGREAVRPQS